MTADETLRDHMRAELIADDHYIAIFLHDNVERYYVVTCG